jgi:hypothetical protein
MIFILDKLYIREYFVYIFARFHLRTDKLFNRYEHTCQKSIREIFYLALEIILVIEFKIDNIIIKRITICVS